MSKLKRHLDHDAATARHIRVKAKGRIKLNITKAILTQWEKRCRNGYAKRLSNNRWAVEHQKKWYVIVLDPISKKVVTVLCEWDPEEYPEVEQ